MTKTSDVCRIVSYENRTYASHRRTVRPDLPGWDQDIDLDAGLFIAFIGLLNGAGWPPREAIYLSKLFIKRYKAKTLLPIFIHFPKREEESFFGDHTDYTIGSLLELNADLDGEIVDENESIQEALRRMRQVPTEHLSIVIVNLRKVVADIEALFGEA